MFNLKNTILINGSSIPIATDFRIWLKFQDLIQNLKENEESFYKLLNFFIEIGLNLQVDQFEDALNEVVSFFSGEKQNKDNLEYRSEKVFDFHKDEKYIYSAFLQEYGIDLYEIEYLHWHKFKSLLQSLSENCQLTKIIQYRSVDTSKMDKENKKFYKKMKQIYALDIQEEKLTTEQYHNNIREKLKKRFEDIQKIKGGEIVNE